MRNKEKRKAYDKAYREANKDKRKAYNKMWHETNNAYDKAYRKINKDKSKAWYIANKEKALASGKNWREANKERIKAWREINKEKTKAQHKIWYKANKEKQNIRSKIYNEANKEKLKARAKAYYKANRGKVNIYLKRKRESDPKFRLNSNISLAIRLSLKGNKNGRHWEDLVGYTLEDIKKHLEKQFVTGMSWENYGGWNIDHKIPIAVFNFTKTEHMDFKRCWALKNLQPLWSKDNFKKGSSINKHFQPALPI